MAAKEIAFAEEGRRAMLEGVGATPEKEVVAY